MYQVDRSIDQLGYNQPAGFYLQLLLTTAVASSNYHCLLPAGTATRCKKTKAQNGLCVDGGIERISFLQPVVAGKKKLLRVWPTLC